MSQEKVQLMLEELGGRATSKQIKKLARERYPRLTLFTYVGRRLESLEKWGIVARDGDYWVVLRPIGKIARR